jgi:hypothetical protein
VGNLLANERFKKHMVRGAQHSFILAIHEQKDKAQVLYSRDGQRRVPADRPRRSPNANVEPQQSGNSTSR